MGSKLCLSWWYSGPWRVVTSPDKSLLQTLCDIHLAWSDGYRRACGHVPWRQSIACWCAVDYKDPGGTNIASGPLVDNGMAKTGNP